MSERNIPLTSVTLLSLVSNRARRLREIVNDLGENWMPVFLQTVFAVPVEFPEAIRGSTDVFFRVKNGNEPLIAFVADGEKSDWFVDAFIYEGEKETSVLAPGAMFVIPLA